MSATRAVQRFAIGSVTLAFFLSLAALAARPPTEESAHALYQKVQGKPASTLQGLDRAARQRLFDATLNHPVASLTLLPPEEKEPVPPRPWNKYETVLKLNPSDPPVGVVGYCFGRAMTAHLNARYMKLAESSIRKLFIIGDLRSGPDPEWRFHVTTLVKGTDGIWYAIDPIMTQGTPLPASEWIETVKGIWDKDDKAYLYVTAAATVVPDLSKDADGVTGNAVLELVFDPRQKGFPAYDGEEYGKSFGKYTVYSPTRAQQIEYFQGVLTSDPAKRFKLLSISVPKLGEINYKGFFVDLLQSFTRRERVTPRTERFLGPAAPAPEAVRPVRGNLYSPRLFGK